jgi:hypothetical protein
LKFFSLTLSGDWWGGGGCFRRPGPFPTATVIASASTVQKTAAFSDYLKVKVPKEVNSFSFVLHKT